MTTEIPLARVFSSGLTRVRAVTRTTPGLYRAWSIATGGLLVAASVLGFAVANRLQDTTARLQSNTGPVLVATQQAAANLAEADAAASAAFLSGPDEDPESRRQYEDALARASARLEDVSALIGSDVSAHDVLKDLGALVTRYAALVDAARAENRAAEPDAADTHVEAVELLSGSGSDGTEQLTDVTEARLERDSKSQVGLVGVALLAVVASAVLLVTAQVAMFRRSRRIVNLPLALATAAAVAAGLWLLIAYSATRRDLDTAREDGYESIKLTADIQVAGQRTRAAETVALITGDRSGFEHASSAALDVDGLLADLSDRADSSRERAAVAELVVRWGRYRDTAGEIPRADDETARELAIGPANSTFNGFNVSVESVLGDNRVELIDGLERSHDRTDWLTVVAGLLPLSAAAAALWGFQLRIREYR